MAGKSKATVSFRQSMFQAGLYKGSQGKIARQVTFVALAITFALASWRMQVNLNNSASLTGFVNWVGGKFASTEDVPLKWNVADEKEIEQNRQEYKKYRSRGFVGRVSAEDNTVVRRFNEQAGSMVMKLGKRGYVAPAAVRNLFVFGLPIAILALGSWFSYRLVNYPRFADFLISVEAELNKVSWPSRGELVRSSMVVIFVIFALAFLLAAFDAIWMWSFTKIGILG